MPSYLEEVNMREENVISGTKVFLAVKTLKTEKAVSYDKIPSEMLKS